MRAEDTTPYDRWRFERAIRAADLPMRAKCTGFALASRARRKSGVWIMTADKLAGEIGAKRSTVFRALRELESAGLLRRIRRSGQAGRRANAYQLIAPATSQIDTLPESRSDTLQPSRFDPSHQPLYRGLSSVQAAAARSAELSAHRERERETPRPGPSDSVPP